MKILIALLGLLCILPSVTYAQRIHVGMSVIEATGELPGIAGRMSHRDSTWMYSDSLEMFGHRGHATLIFDKAKLSIFVWAQSEESITLNEIDSKFKTFEEVRKQVFAPFGEPSRAMNTNDEHYRWYGWDEQDYQVNTQFDHGKIFYNQLYMPGSHKKQVSDKK